MSAPDPNLQVSRTLDTLRGALAEAVTERHYELHPDLTARYGEVGRAKCLQDTGFHLSYLAQSIAAATPALFADYVAWAKVMLAGRGIPAGDLAENLTVLGDVLRRSLPSEMGEVASGYVESGLSQLPQLPTVLPTLLGVEEPHGDLARSYVDALLRGERHVASRLVLQAVGDGVSVKEVYLHVFQRSQHEIGRLWQMNQLSVAQEHYCTAATQLIMSQLYPFLFAADKKGRTLVATCISGDLHEIGVRMVSDFLEMEGWDTFYLGANTPTQNVLQTLADRRADVLAVSATITSHVRGVSDLIAAVRACSRTKHVRVLVGGYPFNLAPDLWRQVGADAFARDAEESVLVANRLAEGGEGSEELVRINNEQTNALRAAMKDLSLQARAQAGRDDQFYDELSRLNNELATAQRELAKKNAELARLNEQKNQFLGIAAHDLRNPLEVILTYSRFLLEDAAPHLEPEHAEFIATIRASSGFMLNLVDDLLDLSRMEAGRLELDLSRVDLGAVVARNVAMNRVLAERKGTEVVCRQEGELPLLRLDAAKNMTSRRPRPERTVCIYAGRTARTSSSWIRSCRTATASKSARRSRTTSRWPASSWS